MFTRIVVVVAISLVKVPCRAAAAPPPPPVGTSDCQLSSHLCKPSSLSLVKTVMNIASVTGCQELCAKDESKKCKFVTFTNFRNIATCHLLAHCDDKVGTTFYIYIFIFSSQLPPCYSLADCSSAPASCDAKTRPKQCAKLEVQGPEEVKWNCGDINPYHSDIPAGTVCTTS